MIRTLLVIAIFCATVIGATPSTRAGDWITDAAAVCAVWNPKPEAGEFIRYTGACKDGLAHGQGQVKWYTEKKLRSIYKGTYRGGKMHGHGVLVMPDGSRFEGTFMRGKRNGHGARRWPNGDFFQGTFADDRRHGPGVMDFAAGFRFAGTYENGKPHGTGNCYTPQRGSWQCRWDKGKLQP